MGVDSSVKRKLSDAIESRRDDTVNFLRKLVQALKDSFQQVKDCQPRVIGANGGCDAWIRSVYGGSSTVTFGPRGGNAHGADEFIYLDDLIATEKILALTILEWCGYQLI